MSKLNRIIAIDNISRNQIIYINANGHTNFNGENGAGKTTTLRASLLFFGSRPGNIAKAKGDSFEGFAAFYFPRLTSFLVFEYERAGELLCVVCSAKNGQVQYQFMNTSFDEFYFLYEDNGKKMIAQTAQLRLNVEHEGYELSRKVGPDVYAEIIQSNKPYRKKNGSFELIRELRPRYSLPTQGGSIQNVDRVLSNIFSSKASIAHIQSALTDILIQDNLIPSRVLKLNEQSELINEWFSARDAWFSLDNRRDNIIALSAAASKYQSLHDQLGSLHHQCQSLVTSQTKKIESLQDDSSATKLKESDSRIKYVELREINGDLARGFNQRIQTLSNQIFELESIKKGFEVGTDKDKPITELIVMHKQLSTYETKEINAKNSYNEVSNGVQDIVSFYEAQQANILTIISELNRNNEALITSSLETKHGELVKSSDLFKQKKDGLISIRDTKRDTLQTKIVKGNKQSAVIGARLQDVSFSPEYRDSIACLDADISIADKDFQEALSDNKTIIKALDKFKADREDIVKSLVETKVKRQGFIDKQNIIKKRLENGSLFDYLHENVDDFESTIGKVINPDLLEMKGLSPSFEQATTSLYGLSLNLDGIDSPTLLNKTELHDQIISLDELIVEVGDKISNIESNLGKQNDNVRKSEGERSRSELELTETQRYLTEQKEALIKEKEKAHVDLTSRHEEHKVALTRCNTELGQLNTQDRSLMATYDTETSRLSHEEREASDKINQAHCDREGKLKQSLKESLDEQSLASRDIDKNKASDIQEKGLSPERIAQAKAAYVEAQDDVRRANRAGERVARYNAFLSTQWIKNQPLCINLEAENQQQKEFELSSTHEDKKLKAEFEGFTKEISSINNEITTATNERRICVELVEAFTINCIEPDANKADLFKGLDSNQCKIKFTKLKADFDSYKSRGLNEFNELDRTFCKTTGTPTRKFYEKMRNELLKTYQSSDLWWACASTLSEYIENEHISQSDLLRSNYILVAKKIADFSELITSTHKSLNNLGKKLTTTTRNVVDCFEAIGQIEIRVSSKLKNLSYFSALESFSQAHENWSIHNSETLPDDTLISKLTNLINMIGSNKLEINVDKSFLFEVDLEDNGITKRARTDEEIETLSSTGLSYLIITAIYIGLINLLRTDPNIKLLFCVDEIGKLSKKNTGKLIGLFDIHNIVMYSALPDASAELLQYYPYAYLISETGSHSRTYKLYGNESRVTTQTKIAALMTSKAIEE